MKLLTKIMIFLIVVFASYMLFQLIKRTFNGENKFSLFKSKSVDRNASNEKSKKGNFTIFKDNDKFKVLWKDSSIWEGRYDELNFDKKDDQYIHFKIDSLQGYLQITSKDTIKETLFQTISDLKDKCEFELPSGYAIVRRFYFGKWVGTYTGQYSCDKPNGEGTLLNSDETYLYCNNWIDGKMNGYGKKIIFQDSTFITYEGNFKDGKLFGIGVETNPKSGNTYMGSFVNGEIDGEGNEYYTSGAKYSGQFKKNVWNGYGVYYWQSTHPSLLKYEGNFVNGMIEGKVKVFQKDGTVEEWYFHNNIFVGKNYSDYEKAIKGN